MNIISFFAGCGGMDTGFEQAGFSVSWANEFSKHITPTYELNHPRTHLDKRDLTSIPNEDIPSHPLGIVGGPPCQSWSVAGKGRGLGDARGKLFLRYIDIISAKQPLFFVAENVAGMRDSRNMDAYETIRTLMESAGYVVSVEVLNAADYGVAQNRKRVFFVGYRQDLGLRFVFPPPLPHRITVRDSIGHLAESALPAKAKNYTNGALCHVPNHEYWVGGYSYIYMSRNRVLDWEGQSYTLQAQGRQVSMHPTSPRMLKVIKDVRVFDWTHAGEGRRLSVRECAQIQSFPENYVFQYDSLKTGYQMIGNAVPVRLASAVAKKIAQDLDQLAVESLDSLRTSCAIPLYRGIMTTQTVNNLVETPV